MCCVIFQSCDDCRKSEAKPWGNGRDWNYPKPREGGWVRIWPFSLEVPTKNNSMNNGQIKTMVNKVIIKKHIFFL